MTYFLTRRLSNAGVAIKSNHGKLIGAIVGVVIACAISLLIIACCCCIRRRQLSRASAAATDKNATAAATTDAAVDVPSASAGATRAAPDSPAYREKMRKLEGMSFAKTKSSPLGKEAGNSPGAFGNSPGATGNSPGLIGAKSVATPDATTPASVKGFGSPIYTPRGTNLVTQLFSSRSGPQVCHS